MFPTFSLFFRLLRKRLGLYRANLIWMEVMHGYKEDYDE
jgi:hypothetical protein